MTQQGEERFHGLFLNPLTALNWDTARWREVVEGARRLGIEIVVLQWTACNGRAWYQSQSMKGHHLRRVDDPVALLLELAEAAGLQVLLGTDASCSAAEYHYDPVWASLARHQQVVEELALHCGRHAAFRGFYVPAEYDGLPDETARTYLSGAVRACRRARADALVCWSIRRGLVPITGRNYQTDPSHPLRRREEASARQAWAQAWGRVLSQVAPDAVLLRDDIGSHRQTWEQASAAGEALRAQCDRAGVQLWAQCGLYEVARASAVGDPARLPPGSPERVARQIAEAGRWAPKVFAFDFDYMDPRNAEHGERARALFDACLGAGGEEGEARHLPSAAPRDRSPAAEADPLLAKARRLTEQLRRDHLCEGQVVSVLNTEAPVVSPENEWQEDGDWLTGLYLGAESFRFGATGEEEARSNARESFGALHLLSTCAGEPGVVARQFRRQVFSLDEHGEPRLPWRRSPVYDGYYVGTISRDQLSGHFFGLAAYYDLVAHEAEREIIKKDFGDIVGSILDHRMMAVDPGGEYTLHGSFWAAPLQALTVLRIAARITGKERFQRAFEHYARSHFFLGHALKQAAVEEDCFYEHYRHDSPLYHAVLYESDPKVLGALVLLESLLHRDVYRNGNVYELCRYASNNPESNAGRCAEAELLLYRDDRMRVADWLRDTEVLLAEKGGELAPQVRVMLEAALGRAKREDMVPHYVPIELRPPMEFAWQYWPMGYLGYHGRTVQYSGVDYLLVYWMGRYHGLFP
jgi:hypothetical protein